MHHLRLAPQLFRAISRCILTRASVLGTNFYIFSFSPSVSVNSGQVLGCQLDKKHHTRHSHHGSIPSVLIPPGILSPTVPPGPTIGIASSSGKKMTNARQIGSYTMLCLLCLTLLSVLVLLLLLLLPL